MTCASLKRPTKVFSRVESHFRSPYPLKSFAYSSPYLAAARPDLTVDYSFVSASYHDYAANKAAFVKPGVYALKGYFFSLFRTHPPEIQSHKKAGEV